MTKKNEKRPQKPKEKSILDGRKGKFPRLGPTRAPRTKPAKKEEEE